MSTYKRDTNEQDLIKLLQQGDNLGYEKLYDDYAPMLFGIISKIVGNGEDAENLLQDCFVKIWKHIEQYDASKGRFATWLINIARNTAIDFIRSKAFIQRGKNQTMDNLVSLGQNLSTTLHTDTLDLRQLVNKLTPQCREVIEWMYFDGFTQQEIAENFNIPLGTVKTRARMGLLALKEYFE
ncbi:MAG: RNA polymerase sigma factor [Saprospiraceae bacterium]|nr:RNA polymerase sigma factor [Saprospiraceae bacterium]